VNLLAPGLGNDALLLYHIIFDWRQYLLPRGCFFYEFYDQYATSGSIEKEVSSNAASSDDLSTEKLFLSIIHLACQRFTGMFPDLFPKTSAGKKRGFSFVNRNARFSGCSCMISRERGTLWERAHFGLSTGCSSWQVVAVPVFL